MQYRYIVWFMDIETENTNLSKPEHLEEFRVAFKKELICIQIHYDFFLQNKFSKNISYYKQYLHYIL